jgi:hypothetical protein
MWFADQPKVPFTWLAEHNKAVPSTLRASELTALPACLPMHHCWSPLQEVRKVVEAGLPEGLASQLGSIILDSRYSAAS